MKKTILITILALLGITQAVAQEYEYVPFVREGVKWVYYINYPEWSNPNPNFNVGLNYRTLEIKGDVVINGKTYKAMHKYSGDAIDPHIDTIPIYLREEDNVVYGIIPDGKMYYDCPIKISWLIDEYNGEEFVLYDFNDQESFWDGILNIDFDDCYEFISTQFITLGSHRAKQYVNKYNGTDFYFIEGIGIDTFTNGFMLYPFMGRLLSGPMFHLSHVIENDEIVYKSVNYLEPEPDDYEYVPFVREGVKWVYYINNYHFDLTVNPAQGCNICYRTLEIKGDTVINGKAYKAMHKYSGSAINEENDTIPIYLREENKIVYGIVPDGKYYDDCFIFNACTADDIDPYDGHEFVLYDFNDPVGYWKSFIPEDYAGDWTFDLEYTDFITVGDHIAKRYDFYIPDFIMIEGIGAITYNGTPLSFFNPQFSDFFALHYGLYHVLENDEVVYKTYKGVDDRYLPVIRDGVKWINEKVIISNGDTTRYYYAYEFNGNAPFKDGNGDVFKALYYTDYPASAVSDSLIAGIFEWDGFVASHRNYALDKAMNEGRNMMNFNPYMYSNGTRELYQLNTFNNELLAINDYIHDQKEQFLTKDNFVMVDPIEIDGVICSRCAYVKENGDTMCYVVEGIGFDSNMGDLLTPFTREPDPDADYQEYWGLSHVVKNGKIIYKGMRFNPALFENPGDVNGDGEVNIADANSVIDIVILGGNAGHTRAPAADANHDGEVNIGDINYIINFILNGE